MKVHPLCSRCNERWPQHRNGLCRQCARTVEGFLEAEQRAREAKALADHIRREQSRIAAEQLATPPREVVYDGQLYEVIWAGVGPLPRPRRLFGA